MKYVCDTCKREYTKEADALMCEKVHKEAEENKAKDEKRRLDAEKGISDAINAFVKKYGELPNMNLTKESTNTISKQIKTSLEDLLDAFNWSNWQSILDLL